MGPHEKSVLDDSTAPLSSSSSRLPPTSAEQTSDANNITGNNGPPKMVATPSMCYHCFDTLIDALQNPTRVLPSSSTVSIGTTTNTNTTGNKRTSASTQVPDFIQDLVPDASVECPVFITWDKQKKKNPNDDDDDDDDDEHSWSLRGCIGTLSPRLLATAVGEYALISALRDRRFRPIAIHEVSALRVSISLLVDYEECQDVYDWVVGVHGILIKFSVSGDDGDDDYAPHHYNATYLPEVAKQQHWDQQQTVSSLIRKAGYTGSIDDNLLKRIHCTRYQSSKCQVTFAEYVLHNCQGNDPIPPTHKSRMSSWVSPCINM